MSEAAQMSGLVKELEQIFTIDGKGRPAKARSLIQLVDQHGLEKVLDEIKRLSEREFV